MDVSVLTPEKITIITGMLLILGAGYKEIWVWGKHYQRELERANRLESLVYQLAGITGKLVERERQQSGGN